MLTRTELLSDEEIMDMFGLDSDDLQEVLSSQDDIYIADECGMSPDQIDTFISKWNERYPDSLIAVPEDGYSYFKVTPATPEQQRFIFTMLA